MTESTPPIPARDDELTENVVRFKRTFEGDVTTIKRNLAQWLDANPSNSTATRIALLETAFDGYLAERTSEASDLGTAAADATDIVPHPDRAFTKERSRGGLCPHTGDCPELVGAFGREQPFTLTTSCAIFAGKEGPSADANDF
jgi:hypothetical protein